jgi:hypothetical protein
MGVDSVALLLRWLAEPQTRPCDPADWLVVTAQTGDEFPVTGELVARHILPLFREHGIRWAEVARGGPRQADGVTVLSDSRCPDTVHLAGAYKLSQEMLAAGTVPQVGGARKCSAKAKGWPLDQFIAAQTAGEPYLHVVGFEVNETRRALRDARFNTAVRTGVYPLIDWGWDRAAAEAYIRQQLGVRWIKSACTYCPFALQNHAGRRRVTAAYQQDPQTAITGLVMETAAAALNSRQGLIPGRRLAGLLAETPGHEPVLALLEERLASMPWRVYEVRRAILPRPGEPARAGSVYRSVRAVASGTRTAMASELARIADARGARIVTEDGIPRAWRMRRCPGLPAAEWFFAAAPATPDDKQRPGFAAAWRAALAGPARQLTLFPDAPPATPGPPPGYAPPARRSSEAAAR